MTRQNDRLVVFVIFFVAVALRLLHFSSSSENPLLYMPVLDERYYIDLGKDIAAGHWVGEDRVFFMDPLYGYFLGVIFGLFGDNLTTVRIIQILFDALNVLLIYTIGKKVLSRFAGISGALFYALYPVALFYTLLILKTTLSITASLAFVLLLLVALEKSRKMHWLNLGLLAGAMTCLRANFVLVVPLTILFCLFLNKSPWRVVMGQSFLLFAGLVTVLSVGALRNYRVSNDIVFFNSQGGRLLYSSNNPENITGLYKTPSFARPDPEASERDFHREAEFRRGEVLSQRQVSRYWTGRTIGFLVNNPVMIPTLLYNKFKRTLGNCEIANNHSYYTASIFSPWIRWPKYCFAFALALGVPGLVMGIRRNREIAVFLIPVLTVLATVLVFYTSSRLRMPLVPFLLIGAAIFLNITMEWIKKKETPKILVALLSMVILGWLSLSVPCPKEPGREQFILAKAYLRQGDLHKARQLALKGRKAFPSQTRFLILLGMIAISSDLPDQAIQHNRRVLAIEPENVDAHHNMGVAYLSMKKSEQAVTWFQKALAIEERTETLFWLAKAYEEGGHYSSARKKYDKFLSASKKADPLRGTAIDHLESLNRLQRRYGKE